MSNDSDDVMDVHVADRIRDLMYDKGVKPSS